MKLACGWASGTRSRSPPRWEADRQRILGFNRVRKPRGRQWIWTREGLREQQNDDPGGNRDSAVRRGCFTPR